MLWDFVFHIDRYITILIPVELIQTHVHKPPQLNQRERSSMPEEQSKQDDQEKRIKDLHVHIPWRLAERIRDYAAEES